MITKWDMYEIYGYCSKELLNICGELEWLKEKYIEALDEEYDGRWDEDELTAWLDSDERYRELKEELKEELINHEAYYSWLHLD